MGGDVLAGMGYMVGERGKELFVPDVSGAIVPNNKIGQQPAAQPKTSIVPFVIHNDVKLDGRVIWESVRRYSAAEIRRMGG